MNLQTAHSVYRKVNRRTKNVTREAGACRPVETCATLQRIARYAYIDAGSRTEPLLRGDVADSNTLAEAVRRTTSIAQPPRNGGVG